MVNTLRHVAAVLVGYVIFASLSLALFAFSHRDPHAAQDSAFIAFSIVYGILAAVIAGYAAGYIGRGDPVTHTRTLALAIAAVAIVSLLARPGAGSVWTQLASVFLFAPSTLVGGWLRAQQMRTK